MSFEIFKITEEGKFAISDYGIFHYRPFKKILARDQGSDGDTQGRNKVVAYKEFAYIYFIADVNSVPNRNGYSKKEAELYAVEHALLGKDWKPDEEIGKAIEIYKSAQKTPERELVDTLLVALRNSYNIIKILNGKMTKALEAAVVTDEEAIVLMDIQEKLLKLASTLPGKIKEFKDAIDKIDSSDAVGIKMRGTDEIIPDSADPNNSL